MSKLNKKIYHFSLLSSFFMLRMKMRKYHISLMCRCVCWQHKSHVCIRCTLYTNFQSMHFYHAIPQKVFIGLMRELCDYVILRQHSCVQRHHQQPAPSEYCIVTSKLKAGRDFNIRQIHSREFILNWSIQTWTVQQTFRIKSIIKMKL